MKAKNEARTIASLKGRAACIASIASLLLVAGCMTQGYPPAPKESATADYNYHIGALDVVNVIVFLLWAKRLPSSSAIWKRRW